MCTGLCYRTLLSCIFSQTCNVHTHLKINLLPEVCLLWLVPEGSLKALLWELQEWGSVICFPSAVFANFIISFLFSSFVTSKRWRSYHILVLNKQTRLHLSSATLEQKCTHTWVDLSWRASSQQFLWWKTTLFSKWGLYYHQLQLVLVFTFDPLKNCSLLVANITVRFLGSIWSVLFTF